MKHRPRTPEGRLFARELGEPSRPVQLRRRNLWHGPRPADWRLGWLELYRDGRLHAVWDDLDHIDSILRSADRRHAWHLVQRDAMGMSRRRYVAYFKADDELPQLIPIEGKAK